MQKWRAGGKRETLLERVARNEIEMMQNDEEAGKKMKEKRRWKNMELKETDEGS